MTAAKAVKLRSNCIFFSFVIILVDILSKSLAIIKCDLNPEDFLVWRYPDSSPALGSQIIVSQSQQAIVLASGELVDILVAGSHTLLTANIPILKDYLQDGSESFPFDIWFVNKISITSYKWGTKSPIQFREKQFGVMLPIGSYGSYECEIKDFQAFLLRVVGTRYKFSSDDLKEFLAPLVEREAKDAIASEASKSDIFNISEHLNKLSLNIRTSIKEKFKTYGIDLRDFYAQNISIVSNDPSFEKLKQALSEAASIKLKGKAVENAQTGYSTEKSLEVLKELASNKGGTASEFTGAGLGLGAGFGFGNKFLDMTNKSLSSPSNEKKAFTSEEKLSKNNSGKSNSKNAVKRLKSLKELLDMEAITKEEFDIKKKEMLDDL